MKKSDAIALLKTAILGDGSVIKRVTRGRISSPSSVHPYVAITVPLHEPFVNPVDNRKIPFIKDIDLLVFVNVLNKPGIDFNDQTIDSLVEYIKEKIDGIPDGSNIIGVEWQHDEEFEGESDSELGVAIFYKLQYRDAPNGR